MSRAIDHVTSSDYAVVRYRADLKDQVIRLQTNLWSPDPILNRAYFEWKFEQNPYQNQPLIYLGMFDGEIVGMRSFFATRWEAGVAAERTSWLYADDAVVVPAHRRSGVMRQIMSTALSDLVGSGYDYLLNLSAGPMTFLASLSQGWHSAGYVRPMRRRSWRIALSDRLGRLIKQMPALSRKADALRGDLLKESGRPPTELREPCARALRRSFPEISYQNVSRIGEMADLIERLGSSGRISHVRDGEYFEWRFQNPLSRYRFLFHDGERLEGYLVLQEYTSEYAPANVINIVDWEASSVGIKAQLLRAALRLTGEKSVNIWSATLSEETIDLLSREHFYFESPEPSIIEQCPGILVRSLGDREESDWTFGGMRLTELENWDLRMLFSMRG